MHLYPDSYSQREGQKVEILCQEAFPKQVLQWDLLLGSFQQFRSASLFLKTLGSVAVVIGSNITPTPQGQFTDGLAMYGFLFLLKSSRSLMNGRACWLSFAGMEFKVCVPCTCGASLPAKTSVSSTGGINLVSNARGYHYITLPTLNKGPTPKKNGVESHSEENELESLTCARGSVIVPDLRTRVWLSAKSHPSVRIRFAYSSEVWVEGAAGHFGMRCHCYSEDAVVCNIRFDIKFCDSQT